MEGEGGDPLSVNKNPRIIKAAQEEVACLDVLVCGICHYVFHFIEEFEEHKNANECGKPTFKANLSESKPQVWAFLLWKSSVMNQHKADGEREPINSWKLYQRWCKMAENTRESWIAAGKSIQTFSTLANAKIAEVIHSSKSPVEAKPRVVTTKSMPITDDEEDEHQSEDFGGNDIEIKTEQRKVVRKIVRIPVDKNGSVRDVRPVRSGQGAKEIRTYSTRRDPSGEIMMTKAGVNESVPAVSESSGGEKDASVESEEKENLKEPTDQATESAKPGKEAEEKSSETLQTKMEELKPVKTGDSKLVKDPLGDGMVEIKVENMSSEEDQAEEQQERGAASIKLRVRDSFGPASVTQRPGTVKRKPLPASKLSSNRVMQKSGKGKDSEDEYVVEKILAKRFNPKRKYYEYLVKWEGYPHDQNTWEPVENMAACDKLVETFERNLARQKAMQLKASSQLSQQQKLNQVVAGKPLLKVKSTAKTEELNQPGPSGVTNFESRPVRSSKKRALEQVKSWCGSMTKKEFETGKRKPGEESDSDDDMAPDKKIKLEPPDDDWSGGEIGTSLNSGGSSDDDSSEKRSKPSIVAVHGNQHKVMGIVHKAPVAQLGDDVIKRGPGRPPKRLQSIDSSSTINGIAKNRSSTMVEKDLAVELGLASDSSPEHKSKPQPTLKQSSSSQPPVLVANSKGVIKVDPRQVPNLTSGVYIVSNKSGIVKLNDLPSSPVKGSVLPTNPSPQGQKVSNVGVVVPASKRDGIQTGIVRKPLSQPSTETCAVLGQTSKQGMAVRTPINLNSGLIRVAPPGSLNKSVTGLSHMPTAGGRPPLMSPRAGSRPTLSSPRPLSVLTQRPGLLQAPLRPGLQPRIPGMSLRPGLGSLGFKRLPVGVPGVQTKITSALRPKMPLQSPLGRGLIRTPSPAAQVKSGIKPIHAMLGKAVQSYGPSSAMTAHQRLILAKKQQPKETAILVKQGSGGVVMSPDSVSLKPGLRPEDPKLKKPLGRGRGRGHPTGEGVNNRQRDSKLVDGDGLHMEFHEVHTSSDSDDGIDSLPELPMGDLPSLEPESPPRPFTLCPETGKILGQAEGEPTPVPSPEPEHEPESIPKTEEEAEEILPDKREGSPIRIAQESPYPSGDEETLLKVEMSPGGTTGTVIESNVADPTTYMNTLRTEEGLTVTKISTTNSSTSGTQQQVSLSMPKVGGGISVPARKLFLDSTSNSGSNSGAGTSSSGGSNGINTELVTFGEDGVVYQISTEEEQEGGETMLVSADGEPQCVYVTAEQAAGMEDGSVLTLDTAVAEAVAQLIPDQVNVIGGGSGCSQFYVKEGDGDSGQLMITSGVEQGEEMTQAQVVAQVVQEGEPVSGTGATRRVVLLLPDGNLMMTEVDEEQYAALELDK